MNVAIGLIWLFYEDKYVVAYIGELPRYDVNERIAAIWNTKFNFSTNGDLFSKVLILVVVRFLVLKGVSS